MHMDSHTRKLIVVVDLFQKFKFQIGMKCNKPQDSEENEYVDVDDSMLSSPFQK